MTEPPARHVPLLEVRNLSVEFRTRTGTVFALEDLSFSVDKGETVALVGESGSGKSVTAYALLGISDAAARITGGTARFGGSDLLALPERVLKEIRGREVSIIFQNARAALNPIRPIGRQIADILRRHGGATHLDAPRKAVEMLAAVRIPDPARRAASYPFELSGGMCQRVMIAMALACSPALLIADEPTTGLDVTTQAAIMDLIRDLGRERGMATILITHDLGLAAENCDRIIVMHAGHIVEDAPTAELFARPRHPYTRRLIGATPAPGRTLADLVAIPGHLPDLRRVPLPACRYAARCERRDGACDTPLPRVAHGATTIACHHPL